jgi:hypothetical protein
MSFSIANLTSVISSLGTAFTSMTPAQQAAAVTGGMSMFGPSTAEEQLGNELNVYKGFAVKAFVGSANDAMFATMAQGQIMGIVGLPTNVTNLLPTVFAAKDEATLDAAIAQVKNAAGL